MCEGQLWPSLKGTPNISQVKVFLTLVRCPEAPYGKLRTMLGDPPNPTTCLTKLTLHEATTPNSITLEEGYQDLASLHGLDTKPSCWFMSVVLVSPVLEASAPWYVTNADSNPLFQAHYSHFCLTSMKGTVITTEATIFLDSVQSLHVKTEWIRSPRSLWF